MNEQTGGLGSSTPSDVPMKRKRGRPRKVQSEIQGTSTPVTPGSSTVLNSNQTPSDVGDDGILGKEVACVIEGTFKGGYLINVNVAADTCLRGVVFYPERIFPNAAQNYVAPQARMAERTDIPLTVPVLNPETQTHGPDPSSGQCNNHPVEAKLQMSMPELPKIDSFTSTGGMMPKGMSKPGPESEPASIADNTLKREKSLHDIYASIMTKESNADAGATKDSKKASGPINLVPRVEKTEKLKTGRHSAV